VLFQIRRPIARSAVVFLALLAVLPAREVNAQSAPPVVYMDSTIEPAPVLQPGPVLQCDGCPRRRLGRAFFQNFMINVFYELANLARGQVTARITPKTWWANMKQGWVWDLDDFKVNQIGHPYQGSNYFNAGRANGLSFWESAGMTAFGSATWEYFGETNHASLNDLINTTLGGIALGEMFHRTAWLVRDTKATGRSRLLKEIAATAIDPVTGLNRFMSDDSSRVSDKPPDMVPTKLSAVTSAGVLWQGTNSNAFSGNGDPFLETDVLYGEPTEGRSRTPYDAFGVRLQFGGGGVFTEARVRGRLLGQPLADGRFQLNVQQDYDFMENKAFSFGAQSFELNLGFTGKLSARNSVRISGWGGLTALGAVDSLPADLDERPEEEEPSPESPGQGVSEGPRFYDYGPGAVFGGGAHFARDGRVFASATYEGHHLYTLDGVRANHLLHQARVDLRAPLRGAFGIGVTGEYFDRRTFYQDAAQTKKTFHFPQFRAYLTWSVR
jgi:hypothetical protein